MSFAVDLYMVRVSDPKIQNEPPILCSPEKIILTKFIFFSPGENFWLINFVCVSCMVRVSVKNLKTLRT